MITTTVIGSYPFPGWLELVSGRTVEMGPDDLDEAARDATLAAIGGVLYVGVINAADLQLVSPYLLPSVAAVVIGGTSIFGGVGGYSGTILGAIILLLAWLYATSTKRV